MKSQSSKKTGYEYFVYGLSEPKGRRVIRYIGSSGDPIQRFRVHISEARSGNDSPKFKWIRDLLSNGTFPRLVIIHESADRNKSIPLEKKEIIKHWRTGRLLNKRISAPI